ncbi:MAG: hypothetical protein ACREBM_01215, partial [Sphingomicrobium sp.]
MRAITFGLVSACLASPLSASAASEWSGRTPAAGFVTGFEKANAEQSILERIPKGESVQKWTRMLTSQRFIGRGRSPGPEQLLANIQGLLANSCPGAGTSPIVAMTVSGRPAARMRADCPLNPTTGLPETFFIIAFAGTTDLFAEQVAFRRVPSVSDVT